MAVTSVASTTTSTALLAAGARTSVIIGNSDANALYVLIGSGTASASNASIVVPAGDTVEVPRAWAHAELTGVWAADGSGYALITYK